MRFSQLTRPYLAAGAAFAALTPLAALAQTDAARTSATAPIYWYLLAAAVAILTAVGLVLIGVAGLERDRAWDAALGAVAAIGLAMLAYWAVGFALQFGGVGLVYTRPELHGLVWEWSPLSTEWGVGWGVAGLSGWLLAGRDMTALVYALFLSHLPWLFVVTLLPVMALRGRAPVLATLVIALLMGGVVYPLAGNWVQGGGWLSALGRNLNLGHGFIDAGGAGTVFLLAAVFGLVGLMVWTPRRAIGDELPPDYQPLLTVAGSLLVLAGLIGWLWANPLQVETVGDLGMMRGSVNVLLAAAAGVIAPLLYTWFVTGRSHPTLVARGLVAGAVAGLAAAPFTSPGAALGIGALAGATTPLLAYVVDGLLRLDDATGLVVTAGAPAIIGLLLAGIVADGVAGVGWQMTGLEAHLGVAGQGVSGLLVAQGFQPDFPGQFQAQLIGVAVLILWGLLTGLLISAPLGLLFWGLQHSERTPPVEATPALPRIAVEPEPAPSERRRVFPPFPSDPAA